MPHSRRSVLIAGSSALTALSGCQHVGWGHRPQIGLTLRNYTDQPQSLKLELLAILRLCIDPSKTLHWLSLLPWVCNQS